MTARPGEAAPPAASGPPAPPPSAPAAPVLVVASAGAAFTRGLAGRLAGLLQAGDVVLLGGQLGAGKTTFTQGVARALGVRDVVASPTFTLVRDYPTGAGFRLLHADVYRLEALQEVLDLAIPEQLEDGACALIEWGERAAPALSPDYLALQIDYGPADTDRVLTFRPFGERWTTRFPALAAALGRPAPEPGR